MSIGFFKDFSRIEALLLLCLVCALIAITVPNFQKFRCRAKQSEAKFLLQHVYGVQKLFYSGSYRYALLHELVASGRLIVEPVHYSLVDDQEELQEGFAVKAVGKRESGIERDIWVINQGGKLEHLQDGCH